MTAAHLVRVRARVRARVRVRDRGRGRVRESVLLVALVPSHVGRRRIAAHVTVCTQLPGGKPHQQVRHAVTVEIPEGGRGVQLACLVGLGFGLGVS